MNFYDDEARIIESLQFVNDKKVGFINISYRAVQFFLSLHREKRFRNWINSSGKDVPPPDFYSKKYKYMLEVMRVDDFVKGNHSPNALESAFLRNVESALRENGKPSMKDLNIQMMVIPNMKSASENNYVTYVENFRRVVKKHLEKIPDYRRNHPGYKLGFLVFDESAGYIQVEDPNVKRKPGERISGIMHSFYYDRNFVDVFEGQDLDFLIWMTPNKNLPENQSVFPDVVVFDLKGNNKWKKKITKFDYEKTVCWEARE